MNTLQRAFAGLTGVVLLVGSALFATDPAKRVMDINPKPISSDSSVKYDYDIVYVRAPRYGDERQIIWPEVFAPFRAEPRADLMLLHPDGREEVLVDAGGDSITDPYVSFDGQWVFYARFHNVKAPDSGHLQSHSSDIFKIHVPSRKIVQLTQQGLTPNSGVVDPGKGLPVFNLSPCPMPGGKLMFTSTRNGLVSSKDYEAFAVLKDVHSLSTLQLFSMDDDGKNVELIGHQNLNAALHPTILKDGRVMFTSYESEGLRDLRTWAIWTIHPDGTNWFPLFSALGGSGETARHFMSQLSDGTVVAEEYYFQRNLGFGTFFRMSPSVPDGQPYFGSASLTDPRNYVITQYKRVPFSPHGMDELTRFTHFASAPAYPSDPNDPKSLAAGKVTLPSGAPDNHLLLVYSPGPAYGIAGKEVDAMHPFRKPAIDSGIYLLKSGKPIDEPGKVLLIKNDPNYNEQWPRALVPYKRIYGVDEPVRLPHYQDDGKLSKYLPKGAPYGLVGSSSIYKRESYPGGSIYGKDVTAWVSEGADPFRNLGTLSFTGYGGNWFVQGAETSNYNNKEIHAIRVLITEPTTNPALTGAPLRRWWNAGNERLRILGEIPVRKFRNGKQPLDPDGNPDTSFLIKLPADVAWTWQTLDKDGMVLNMSQTWHQLRPGEIRTNCGGCHAHSQTSTLFEKTAAARPEYPVFDLTKNTPLLTSKQNDQSGRKWDEEGETGLRFEKSALNVEFYRDVKPILDRSCVTCHTQSWSNPAGNLVLDDNSRVQPKESEIDLLFHNPRDQVSGTFMRLAADQEARFGYGSGIGGRMHPKSWIHPQGSRYVRYFQARRSLLAWKIFGRRLDGFKNEDFAYESVPGDSNSLVYKGQHIEVKNNERKINIAYLGTAMPPPEAVAGSYVGPDGRKIKVPALTDEDRRTIVRWIDLGCPIDLDFDPDRTAAARHGWFEDDQRPTLALTYPRAGSNREFTRILVGMTDYETGLDLDSFRVVADFPLNGAAAGQNLASGFTRKTPGVWELKLTKPLKQLTQGKLTVSVKDKQGNLTLTERTFSVR